MNKLTEQVAKKLTEQHGGDIPAKFWNVFSKDAEELIKLITEAGVEKIDETELIMMEPNDNIETLESWQYKSADTIKGQFIKAIRALGEVKE